MTKEQDLYVELASSKALWIGHAQVSKVLSRLGRGLTYLGCTLTLIFVLLTIGHTVHQDIESGRAIYCILLGAIGISNICIGIGICLASNSLTRTSNGWVDYYRETMNKIGDLSSNSSAN